MTKPKPHRPVSSWGSGDLPAPFAITDIVDVPADAKALERMHGMGPGRYEIVTAYSIDEGDAWYFRLAPNRRDASPCSDRLHVIHAERCDNKWAKASIDWLEGCTVTTRDSDGLAKREAMIAAGWEPPHRYYCPTCGHEIRSV